MQEWNEKIIWFRNPSENRIWIYWIRNKTHKLTEVNIEKGFPRYLFYSLNNEGINNINQENEKVDNINTNRLVSEESKLKVSVKK